MQCGRCQELPVLTQCGPSMDSYVGSGSWGASVLLYRVATLFFQPGLACPQPMHGEVSDMVKCSVENAKRCSVSRNWKVMLEESSKQPLSDCIGWTHYSYNQVHPSLQPSQFGQKHVI